MSITIERGIGSITISVDGRGVYSATRDGTALEIGICRPETLQAARVTLPAEHASKGYTHVLANICLTASEAEALAAEAEAARAIYLASPDGLHAQRAELVSQVGEWMDTWHELHQQAITQMSATGTARLTARVDAASAEADRARAALAAWDAAHPEVLAQIEQQRQADVARHMWD